MTLLTAITTPLLLALGASPTPIDFDGERYEPAFTSRQPQVRLVEYVRSGETVENWTKLIAVRNFPQQTDPRMAVHVFQRVVKEHNPLAGVQVLVKEDGSEAMIDFLTWETGGPLELNIHRYVKKPGYPGLVSYQFAFRFRQTPEVTADQIRTEKERWGELLRQLEPAVGFDN